MTISINAYEAIVWKGDDISGIADYMGYELYYRKFDDSNRYLWVLTKKGGFAVAASWQTKDHITTMDEVRKRLVDELTNLL